MDLTNQLLTIKTKGMRAEELRVGNYYIDYQNNVREWSLLDFYILEDTDIELGEIIREFIPLTKEWYKKTGFKEDLNIHYKVVGNQKIEIDENNGVFITDLILKETYFLRHFDYEYLHQLQNLYFILTGEELTINQPLTNYKN